MFEIYWEYVIKFNPMKYQWSGGRPLPLFFATRQASEAHFDENVMISLEKCVKVEIVVPVTATDVFYFDSEQGFFSKS